MSREHQNYCHEEGILLFGEKIKVLGENNTCSIWPAIGVIWNEPCCVVYKKNFNTRVDIK